MRSQEEIKCNMGICETIALNCLFVHSASALVRDGYRGKTVALIITISSSDCIFLADKMMKAVASKSDYWHPLLLY